jgi:ABC-2 type transport system ATP-binding protein
MLAATQLGKCFKAPRWALRDLSFSVANGELVMLLGANGAGKTTTINCFLDFITPTTGSADVDGVSVRNDPLRAKSRIAHVPELVSAYGAMSGIDNLRFFAALSGRGALESSEAAQALVQSGVPRSSVGARVQTYSKGMRQKLGLAIARVRGAPNLILDEPTSGLDPISARELMRSLRRLADAGCAVLVSTHDLYRAREYADRAYILSEGQLRRVVSSTDLAHVDLGELYAQVMRDNAEAAA